MAKNKIFNNRIAFTLIELLVVISIIGFISIVAMAAVSNSRKTARDAKRIADIKQVIKAIEMFYDANKRYPDNAHEGLPSTGEVIGDNDTSVNNTIEKALATFLPYPPLDPSYNGSTTTTSYYYAYDYSHTCPTPSGLAPAISINRFETTSGKTKYGTKDTSSGGDSNINTADFNYCFK